MCVGGRENKKYKVRERVRINTERKKGRKKERKVDLWKKKHKKEKERKKINKRTSLLTLEKKLCVCVCVCVCGCACACVRERERHQITRLSVTQNYTLRLWGNFFQVFQSSVFINYHETDLVLSLFKLGKNLQYLLNDQTFFSTKVILLSIL